jgi:type II secretory pathway pseudopilin PulG
VIGQVIGVAGQVWSSQAIHDTVAVIVRDRAYRRSVLGSLLGRALMAFGDAVGKLIDAIKRIPGGGATVMAVVAVIAALIVIRLLMTSEWEREDAVRRRGAGGRAARSDPWAEAERLAAQGDYTGAAHALYQAVLRRLATAERIRVHASKTSGDYWRELRRRGSPAALPFQHFGRRFDRVIFGIGTCSPAEFEAMLREATAITPRQAA